MSSCSGKIAIVTGAGSGIGKAVALGLAREEVYVVGETQLTVYGLLP